MMRPVLIEGQVSAKFLARLEADEAALVAEVSARQDTMTILLCDGDKTVGYAVFGMDAHDIVTIYAARSINHLTTKVAMKAFFGVSQILGKAVRVHTEKLDGMARMMGATSFRAAIDSDGIPMGVFGGQ